MERSKGVISYFSHNPVAANLLMIFIIIMGVMSYFVIQRQMFPQPEFNTINVRVSHFGAAPQEIEENILIKIEQAIESIEGMKRVTSQAFRNGGSVTIELNSDQDVLTRLDEVKLQLDSIANFPAGMEPLVVYKSEARQSAVQLMLVGSDDDKSLKRIGKMIEQELLRINDITFVDYNAMPAYEVGIEVPPHVLRKYGLTLNDITQAIRLQSQNISAGMLKTDNGIISLRYENKAYEQKAFGEIPIVTGPSGEQVFLADIATIIDGFEERLNYMRYNGMNATYIAVNATQEQSLPDVAQAVKRFVEQKNTQLPAGYQLHVLVDMTYYLDGRLNMMLKNLAQGSVLVFLILALFLRIRLAFWVMIGLPVTFLGAIWLMPLLGISINLVSLFAFIMVLGIVVDDAIVIGESACSETEKHGHSINNIVIGAKRVATPATFGVLTTIAVFMPFMFSSGVQSSMLQSIAGVAILCLIFSLIESKFILPAHLAHSKMSPIAENHWRHHFNRQITAFLNKSYQPCLQCFIEHRYATLSIFFALLMLAIALVISGNIRVVMTPKVAHDYPDITIEMNKNATQTQTLSVLKAIEKMVIDVDKKIENETGQKMVRDIFVMANGDTLGRIIVPLVDEQLRPIDTFELANKWRNSLPELVGIKSYKISADLSGNSTKPDLSYRLFGKDLETLNRAGQMLAEKMSAINGLYDVASTVDPSSKELQFTLTPVAYEMGLTPDSIAKQIAGSFYGFEAQRLLRDGEDVKVMVRYPRNAREQIGQLNHALITLPNQEKVALGDLVNFVEKQGSNQINREFGYRSVSVDATVDQSLTTSNDVVSVIDEKVIPEILTTFPGITTKIGGAFEEQEAQNVELVQFMITGLLAVYILLAFPLKSYSQPLIIMSVIPFSLTGAILGHYLLGFDLSMMSFFGIVAAAGVVVNDSLVLTDKVNIEKAKGLSNKEASLQAGKLRFRAILITSLTTFLGLLPIMFETSLQAQLVIPMAISLSFAVLYATLITLFLVPCIYVIIEDIKGVFTKRKLNGGLLDKA